MDDVNAVMEACTVRARPWWSGYLCVSHSKSALYCVFVWVCRLLIFNQKIRPLCCGGQAEKNAATSGAASTVVASLVALVVGAHLQ
jgi:hypothetical protein